ncbi:MAG: lipocalin family protein [Chitinophagaceae bacterium]
MKPAVLKILSFIFLLVTAVACSKNNDTPPVAAPKSKTIIITQSAWKIQSVGVDANKDGVVETDITMLVQACKLDNRYTFKTDGTGSMDEASAKCSDTDPQTQPYTWTFKNTETILSGTFSFSNGDATIVSMNETSLVVAYDDAATGSHLLATLKH